MQIQVQNCHDQKQARGSVAGAELDIVRLAYTTTRLRGNTRRNLDRIVSPQKSTSLERVEAQT